MTRLLIVLALALFGGQAQAQTRTISGIVTDSATLAPLAGATLGIQGTRTAVSSGGDGTFTVPEAPEGDAVLIARLIGYRRQEIGVPRGEDRVEVRLVRDVFRLDELVATGHATSVERRNLANSEIGRASCRERV